MVNLVSCDMVLFFNTEKESKIEELYTKFFCP